MERHVMIDVEALRLNRPWIAPLMQVGAVRFNQSGKEQGDFNSYIHPATLPEWATPEQSTVEFWEKEPFFPKLRQRCDRGTNPEALLAGLANFIGDRIVWFAGPQYDQVMLEAYYDHYGMPRPWKYNDSRDFRTIRKQYPRIYNEISDLWEACHDALQDCRFQVEVLREISNRTGKVWR